MTIILLMLLGVVWTALLVVLVSFISKRYVSKFPSRKAQKIFTSGFIALGLSPLLYEYWLYYDFKNYCVGNSGMVKYAPVQADTIIYEGYRYYLGEVLSNPAVKHVVFLPGEGERTRFFDRYPARRSVNEACETKTVWFDRKPFYVDEATLKKLELKGICLHIRAPMKYPQYRLVTKTRQDGWRDSYISRGHEVEYSLQLVDLKTHEVASEYRSVSAPVGPLVSFIPHWGWQRYSCSEDKFTVKFRPEGESEILAQFIDKALLNTAS